MGAGITGSSSHSVRLPAVTGRWGLASLVFSFRVGGIFTESRWREPWRRLGVPVFVRGKGKEREAPISEGCYGYWLPRSPLLADFHGSKVSLSRTIPCRGSVVGEEDNLWDRP